MTAAANVNITTVILSKADLVIITSHPNPCRG